MTEHQLNLLILLMETKMAEHNARDSSDGGLIESMQVRELEKELRATIGGAT